MDRDYGWLPGPPWLWQELGRSAFAPVHCPDWPAPLPPLVGGLGFAEATGTAATASAATDSSAAMLLRVLVILTSFPVRGSLIACVPDGNEHLGTCSQSFCAWPAGSSGSCAGTHPYLPVSG